MLDDASTRRVHTSKSIRASRDLYLHRAFHGGSIDGRAYHLRAILRVGRGAEPWHRKSANQGY